MFWLAMVLLTVVSIVVLRKKLNDWADARADAADDLGDQEELRESDEYKHYTDQCDGYPSCPCCRWDAIMTQQSSEIDEGEWWFGDPE